MQKLGRCCVALLVAVFITGCSSSGPSTIAQQKQRSSECAWNRSSCIYEGSYEAGERDYAEQEARRLNQAQSARLRGGFW